MLAVYLLALAFGGTVLGGLLLLGSNDSGGDHAGDGHDAVSIDHAHAPEAKGDLLRVGPAAVLLSVRFWTFFLAAFGATGSLATLVGAGPLATPPTAIVTGLAVGLGAHLLFRTLQQDRVSGATDLSTLAGEEGTVLVAVRPGARGRIRIVRPSGTTEVMAISVEAATLDVGARVFVAEVRDGVAVVTQPADDPARAATAAARKQPGVTERTS